MNKCFQCNIEFTNNNKIGHYRMCKPTKDHDYDTDIIWLHPECVSNCDSVIVKTICFNSELGDVSVELDGRYIRFIWSNKNSIADYEAMIVLSNKEKINAKVLELNTKYNLDIKW